MKKFALIIYSSLFLLVATSSFAQTKAYRGIIFDYKNTSVKKAHPGSSEIKELVRIYKDGLLVIENGKVKNVGFYQDLAPQLAKDIKIEDQRGKLIIPGFIDTHIHYPQTEMIGSYGEQLLEWLNTYTFPTERKYADIEYARKMSKFFIKELVKNGTTSALVFGTVHKESVDALFEEALKRDMRIIAGKVMMNRNAPDYLLDTTQSSYDDSKELIKKWHKKSRLLYAITPRFAPTSTPEQLMMANKLKNEYQDTYIHTHLSENTDEIACVKDLFPNRVNYTDVYDYYGLVTSKSIFAHSIHLEDSEFALLGEKGAAVSFCPTSNLFLGSGLFKLDLTEKYGVKVGMGTDVGAGTSFSMLQTLNEAYKVMQLQGKKLSAWEGFYLATLGGAKSLEIDNKIGNFDISMEADFNIIDFGVTDLQKLRIENSKTLEDKLFALMTLGDERNIESTYILGVKQ